MFTVIMKQKATYHHCFYKKETGHLIAECHYGQEMAEAMLEALNNFGETSVADELALSKEEMSLNQGHTCIIGPETDVEFGTGKVKP